MDEWRVSCFLCVVFCSVFCSVFCDVLLFVGLSFGLLCVQLTLIQGVVFLLSCAERNFPRLLCLLCCVVFALLLSVPPLFLFV